ncbi:FAD-binding oxidoreductase [Mesorhizobium sp. KR9-304]|uniref:FAD-binding oxidoreductase n=1 Tax=Mesorhizobium sp. KR9-304 TaxID=3156614 RepID=UPI0032B4A4E3
MSLELTAKYDQDWTGDHVGRSLAVVRPRNVEEVAAVVRWCGANNVPAVPQGGNTGLVAAATPSGDGRELIISLELMNSIRSIDPADGVAVVEAGCVLADLKAAVEEKGAFFPLSIGSQGSCQIGGTISTNAGGINVVRYGMARSLVMGLEVVLPDGRIFRDLRGLHKNNTGYDLKQMFIGAEGTLGIVTAAAVKIQPKPSQCETMFLATASIEDTIRLFHRIRQDAGDLISAFELMLGTSIQRVCETEQGIRNPLPQLYPAYAIVEVSATGGPPLRAWLESYLAQHLEEGQLLDGVIAESGEQVANIWNLREGIVESQARLGVYLRTDVSTPISAVADFIAKGTELVGRLVPGAQVHPYGHVGDGNLHFNVLRPLDMTPSDFQPHIHRIEAALFELVDKYDGSISAEHGIGIAKRSAFRARVDSVQRDLMTKLKNVIDPQGLMSPGRIFSKE